MNPMRGLQNAAPRFGQGTDDPLGIALQARARAERPQYPGFGPLPNPQWEGFTQALNEAGVDRIDPRGFGSPDANIANDPTSTFNTQGGPFGAFGAGTGGIEGPPNPNRFTEPSAPVAGLQAANRRKTVAPMQTSTIQPLVGR